MANSLASSQVSSSLTLPEGVWTEAVSQLTVPANSGTIHIVGYVEDLPEDGMLQVLVNGRSVGTENDNTINIYLMNSGLVVAVDLQAMAAVGSGSAVVTTRGLVVYSS